MKRMLINATHSEEIRVALADGQKLYNLDIDIPGQDRKKGNIYKGKITRVEPSLEAAFVDYGANRHGFLPYKEISRNYYTDAANKAKERPPIAKAVKEGTEVIIQVNKEERGNKGAAISTYISLAGRYMVYMPENPKAGGISRRIEGTARQQLKDALSKIAQPKNSGIIVRTAGIGRTSEELNWDLNYLDQVWTAINTAAAIHKAPHFLYQESDIFIRALRDYLRPDVGEILIDNKEIYEKARDFMQQVMPHNLKKLSYYNDTIPLFSRYQIESQIQSAFSREVHLPSGGSLVIDHTEAMISIDINSARATKGADIEETALNTNLEAADEIARQLRIRDLGGLVVIDFIDMRNHKNQRSVEQQLNEAISNDRARVQTSKISRFGLLEMSRQRLKSSINESSQFVCPRCSGHGFIRNIESLSVSILRILEEEALKPETGKVIAQVPTKVANFIINEKRQELNNLESRHSVPMLIIANEHYQSPQFDIKRLKKSESDSVDINSIQLNKPESEEEAENKSSQTSHQRREHAAVDVLVPESQAPVRTDENKLTSWLKSLFSSNSPAAKTETKSKKKPVQQAQKHTHKKPSRPAQHTNKKPQHNKQQQQNKAKNTQKNKQHNKPKNKPQPNKQQNKNQHQNKQANKQQVNKQQASKAKQTNQHANKQKQNKPQNTPQKQVPVKTQVKDQVAIDPANTNEQILQRPLGSVASYAANKAKQVEPNKTVNKADTVQKSANDDKSATKDNTVGKTNNKQQQPNKAQQTKTNVDDKKAVEQAKNTAANDVDNSNDKPTVKAPEKSQEAIVKAQPETGKASPKKPKVEPKKQVKADTKEKAETTKTDNAKQKTPAPQKPQAKPAVKAETKQAETKDTEGKEPKSIDKKPLAKAAKATKDTTEKAQASSKKPVVAKAKAKATTNKVDKPPVKTTAKTQSQTAVKTEAKIKTKTETKKEAEKDSKTETIKESKKTANSKTKTEPKSSAAQTANKKQANPASQVKSKTKPKRKIPDAGNNIDFDI